MTQQLVLAETFRVSLSEKHPGIGGRFHRRVTGVTHLRRSAWRYCGGALNRVGERDVPAEQAGLGTTFVAGNGRRWAMSNPRW